MQKHLQWKVLLIVGLTALFIYFIYPPEEKIKLGLDLKGGIHMVLRVRVADAVNAEMGDAAQRMKDQLRSEKIRYRRVGNVEDEYAIQITGLPQDKFEDVSGLVDDYFPDFESRPGDPWILALRAVALAKIEESAIDGAKETIENRINQYGLTDPIVQKQGDRRILVQIPGVDDPGRVKGIIQKTAFLEYRRVEGRGAGTEDMLRQQFGGQFPPDTETFVEDRVSSEDGATYKTYYRLRKSPILTGRDLRNARTGSDDQGLPAVHFYLDPNGARKFKKATKEIIDSGVRQQIAIVLDGKIESAPFVNDVISDSGIISGSMNQEDSEDLALVLRAGALPAGLDPLEERTVGPSLGIDSVRQGVLAALLGLALVIIFMVIYYKLSGINAVVALLLNIVLVLGAMSYLSASLTLPGIAGIILIIGMSVDANVLIFERIREEIRVGKTARSAVTGGFGKAFWTIFDANITTLIAAVFLFQFGTGPIKGFAVTLTIGILASMFTAIFVSRVIFEFVLLRKTAASFKLSI